MRILVLALLFPALAVAQTLPATHAYSGLDATSARTRIERWRPRPYGPKFEAFGMPAAPVANPIQVFHSPFRLPPQDLGIADRYDVLFFGEARLVRLRVQVRTAVGNPTAAWTTHLRTYFDFLDRDGNGELNRYEAEYALTNAGVQQMIRTGYAYQRPDDAARTFRSMDQDRDERLSFDEFAYYYAPSASKALEAVVGQPRDPLAVALTAELFKRFDTDKDGRLSKAELTAVEGMFATLDADEDECLSATEVVPNLASLPGQGPTPKGPPLPQAMTVVTPGEAPEGVAEQVLAKYDRDKNLRLSKAENPFGDEAFRRLDKNGNNELRVTELLAWKDAGPDVALELTLGTKPADSSIRLLPGSAVPTGWTLKINPNGTALLTVGPQTIQFECYAPQGRYAQGTVATPSIPTFPNGKGYLTEKDIAGPQFQAFRVLFDMIDRDADNRVTRREYDAFFALQSSFTKLPLSLVSSAQTPSLFQMLDANGDGRLSVREVRDAWARLIALEPGGKEFVTQAALQPRGALRFGRASESAAMNRASMFATQPTRVATKGPTWFRKFDRNADGEVSRSEFPGATADFDRLDADRDGYITLTEAEAADKAARAKK